MEIDKDKDILFLIHRHADPDAIGSAYFLQSRWGGIVASPTGPSGTGKNLLTFLEFELIDDFEFEDFESVIVLDTPEKIQLEPLIPPEDMMTVIDHHKNSTWEGDVLIEDRTSCCEIVYELERPEELTEKEAVALISGILTDTSSLYRGTAQTFKTLSEIMSKSGVSLDQVRSILYDKRSYSEKVARLKGGQRSTFHEVNGFIIALTEIGAFESSVSNYLLQGGADVALSGSENEDSFRISGRAKKNTVDIGIDMSKIFQMVAENEPELSGGGHPGAAVLAGKGDLKRHLDICKQKITENIKEKGLGKSKS